MSGELLTRVTVWLALAGYLAGPLASLNARRREPWQRKARLVYTAGLVFFLAHVALAFHVFYDWSHQVALAETARETFEKTGRRSGAGLYLNYLFTLLWTADVAWWWRNAAPTRDLSRARSRDRPAWVDLALHGFFLFMAFNATVVFEEGAVRWAGVAATLLLLAAILRRRALPSSV